MFMVSFAVKIEYCILFLHFLIIAFVALLILILSYLLSDQKPDKEKLSPYECGFDPFGDSRIKFDIHFYLVSILFIVFDLEIMFLFPWAISCDYTGSFGFFVALFFLFMLGLGFIYEWLKGVLNWI